MQGWIPWVQAECPAVGPMDPDRESIFILDRQSHKPRHHSRVESPGARDCRLLGAILRVLRCPWAAGDTFNRQAPIIKTPRLPMAMIPLPLNAVTAAEPSATAETSAEARNNKSKMRIGQNCRFRKSARTGIPRLSAKKHRTTRNLIAPFRDFCLFRG